MKFKPQKLILRGIFYVWTAAIWIGSLIPMSGPVVQNSDKIQHFMGYGVLALLAQLIWQQPLKVWLGASLMGVAVEFAQAMTPYRSFDTHDMFANCIGAIAGLTLALLWQRYKSI